MIFKGVCTSLKETSILWLGSLLFGKVLGCHLLGKHFRFLGMPFKTAAQLLFPLLAFPVPAAKMRRKRERKGPEAKCQEQQKKTRANRATSQNYLRPQLPPPRAATPPSPMARPRPSAPLIRFCGFCVVQTSKATATRR